MDLLMFWKWALRVFGVLTVCVMGSAVMSPRTAEQQAPASYVAKASLSGKHYGTPVTRSERDAHALAWKAHADKFAADWKAARKRHALATELHLIFTRARDDWAYEQAARTTDREISPATVVGLFADVAGVSLIRLTAELEDSLD